MLPFMAQPAVAPACYVPRSGSAIGQSQLFRGAQYLTRAQVLGSPGVWWASMWVQPCAAANRCLIGAYTAPGSRSQTFLRYDGGGGIQYYEEVSGATRVNVAWSGFVFDHAPYHLLLEVNTAAAKAEDRVKLWKNGISLVGAGSFPSLNAATFFNGGGTGAGTVALGVRGGGSAITSALQEYLSDILSEVMFGDGPGPGVSAIGETNIHGVWVPRPRSDIYAAIAAAGGWGVNGCHLDFSDPLNPGKDVSGRDNHWTASGFDATGKDTVASTPTNVHATFSPLALRSTNAVSSGNLEAGAGGYESIVLTSIPLPDVGRWEAEVEILSTYAIMPCIGIAPATADVSGNLSMGGSAGNGMGLNNHGNLLRDGVAVLSGAGAHSVGDRVRVVFDGPTRKVWVRRLSGGWIGGGDPVAGTGGFDAPSGGKLMFAVSCDVAARVRLSTAFTPTTGCKLFCTANLPEPDIKDPSEAFTQAAATGANILAVLDAATAHWNTDGWVEIIKRRDAAEDWRVRTSDDPSASWATNNANAKGTAAALAAGGAYIGYRLRVGAKYGIWTAELAHTTGTATTVTHGLGTARAVVIATRVSAGGGDRYLRHPDLTAGQVLRLNSNAAPSADATITAFEVNSCQIGATAPSGVYRVIVLAERYGFLDIGKYTGTSAGGFWPTSTAPEWALIRRIDAADSFSLYDRAREPSNPMTRWLQPNSSGGDWEPNPAMAIDLVVGGIKARGSSVQIAASGGQYITVAIGRPIGGVCVAPATAR